MFSCGIRALSVELPQKIVTNFDLERSIDTNDEWIFTRTGIKERRIMESGSVSDLGAAAGKSVIAKSGIDISEIDMLIVSTTSPELVFPSTASIIHRKLGLSTCPAFDVMAACTGFAYALEVAANFIRTGSAKNVLYIAAEAMSKIIDWTDRGTCILFGDAAAAMLLTRTEPGYGLISTYLAADGRGSDLLNVPGGGEAGICSVDPKQNFIQMNGNEVFKFAVRAIPDACSKALDMAGITPDQVDHFVPHQANKRIIESAAQKLSIDPSKVVINIEKYGNTSSASIPLAIFELMQANKLKYGDYLLTAGVGGGFTWGANVIRWNIEDH